jgi:hypothetical protein
MRPLSRFVYMTILSISVNISELKASLLLQCEEKDDAGTVIIDISAEYLKIHRISVNFLYFDTSKV